MNVLRQSLLVCERGIRHLVHHPVSVIFTFFAPIVWLLLFGNLFGDVARLPGFPADNYMSFVLSGVLGILILSVSTFNASNVVFDKVSGFFAKLLSFPVSRMAIAMGYAFDTMTQVLVMVLALLVIGLVAGSGLAAGFLGVLLLLWLSVLFSFGMICLGLSMALASPTAWEFFGMVSFIELPMIFASSALFPQDLMPNWLRVVTMVNPLSYYVNAVRSLIVEGLDWSQIGVGTLALLIFDLLLFVLVRASYRRVVAV